jgi:hypothetical protein
MLFAAVNKEVLSRVNSKHLDASVLMRLLKGLSGAPREYCGIALDALFGAMARHADRLQTQDLIILVRIIANHMDLQQSHDQYSRKEVRSLCQQLAGLSSTGAVAPQFCGSYPMGTWIVYPSMASGQEKCTDQAQLTGSAAIEAEIDSTLACASSPLSRVSSLVDDRAWLDEEEECASVNLSKNASLVSDRAWLEEDEDSERSCERSDETGSERSCSIGGSYGKQASKIQLVCSVKNSFLHYELKNFECSSIAGESTDVGDGDDNWEGSQCSGADKPRALNRSLSAPSLLESA